MNSQIREAARAALEAGDANAYVQDLLTDFPVGGDVIKCLLASLDAGHQLWTVPVREGFASDVATLLRLETQSDETSEEAVARTRQAFLDADPLDVAAYDKAEKELRTAREQLASE